MTHLLKRVAPGRIRFAASVSIVLCCFLGFPTVDGQFQIINQIPLGLLAHLKQVSQVWNATSASDQACLNQLDMFGRSFDAGEPWALSSE